MTEDIHFLVDELQEDIDNDVKQLIYSINHPLAGKNISLLMKITKELIRARAQELIREEQQDLLQELQNARRGITAHQQHERDIIKQLEETAPMPSGKKHLAPSVQETTYTRSTLEKEHTPETSLNTLNIPLIMDKESKRMIVTAELNNKVYTVSQPPVQHQTAALLNILKKELSEKMNVVENKRALYKHIRKAAKKNNIPFNDNEFSTYRYYLIRDLLHYGPVEPFVHDSKITQIICEGDTKPVTIVREGNQYKTNITFANKDHLNGFLLVLAKRTYQQMSMDNPILDATFKTFRIQGTLGTDMIPSRFIMTRL